MNDQMEPMPRRNIKSEFSEMNYSLNLGIVYVLISSCSSNFKQPNRWKIATNFWNIIVCYALNVKHLAFIKWSFQKASFLCEVIRFRKGIFQSSI